MGSRFQFELMTPKQAREILAMKTHQAEFIADRLRAQRALQPVTTEAERRANREYIAAHPRPTR
jgi:4'-phosphopantetheinyl transferase EntD